MTRISPAWLNDPAIVRLIRALSKKGAKPRFVGGGVRNAILGAGETDIDLAIDVEPEETMRLLRAAHLGAVPTGIEHGTVTGVVDKHGFEITTLRRDMETDGRRAVVAFTDDWLEDAKRRDFTMNALYADPDGKVLDPTGEGLDDLDAGRVRFIGHAENRIREDYLRILRFFRFHAWFGRTGMDRDGLAACAELADGIDQLARERIGAEMRKLLAAPDPAASVAAMAQSGVLRHVAAGMIPTALAPVLAMEEATATPPDWRRRLAALGGEDLRDRLRLSKTEMRALEAIRLAAEEPRPAQAAHTHGAEAALSGALIRAAAMAAPPDPSTLRADIDRGATARFPLAAADLKAHGAEPGPAIGAALKHAKSLWMESDFTLDRDALLKQGLKRYQSLI